MFKASTSAPQVSSAMSRQRLSGDERAGAARLPTRLMRLLMFVVVLFVGCGGDAVDGAAGPQSTCVVDPDCDDGSSCTVDVCVPTGKRSFCQWTVAPASCFVHGVCASDGASAPDRPCERCDATRPFEWTALADGAPCDDGSACTAGDSCYQRVCGGPVIACDDGNACTRDGCDAASGCTHAALDGFSCDDGVRCTIDDRCADVVCGGVDDGCDDGDPCTVDACSEVEGCTHEVGALACDDGDACSSNDRCDAGVCAAGAPTNCDDGNTCTIDVCDAAAGCVHLPTQAPCCIGAVSICDDNNVCTDDACDPETLGCTHVANQAACDDHDACTTNDVCADGACAAGTGVACDDGNPCTTDACNAAFPELCLHESIEGSCDDGIACTTDDVCVAGACVGDAAGCVCVPDLSADGVKLTMLAIGTTGTPGDGVDVDADPATCTPSGCSSGVDNTLSIIASLANDPLQDAVANGDVLLVVEVGPLAASPIEVAIYQARLADAGCNVQTQTCNWLVDEAFLDAATCEPIARIAVTLDGNRLTGGGPGTRLPFAIPFGDASLDVVVANLTLDATVTIQGNQVTALTGVLGGAIPKQTLIDGLQGMPDDALPISKEAAIGLVDSLVQNDIDTDQDGTKDAASIGLRLRAIDAVLVGVAP